MTTRPVLLEIGNALARTRNRTSAVALLDSLELDPNVHIEPLTDELYAEGAALYKKHRDKEWGLTDCISFVVMQHRKLTDALTADEHFRQAGFRVLLSGV